MKSCVLPYNSVELAEFYLYFRIFFVLFFIRHSRDHLVFSLELIFAVLLFLEPYFHYFRIIFLRFSSFSRPFYCEKIFLSRLSNSTRNKKREQSGRLRFEKRRVDRSSVFSSFGIKVRGRVWTDGGPARAARLEFIGATSIE